MKQINVLYVLFLCMWMTMNTRTDELIKNVKYRMKKHENDRDHDREMKGE